MTDRQDHYSYTVYADPAIARGFDEQRFGGPIGDLIAGDQADTLRQFLGTVLNCSILDVGTGTGRAAILLAGAGAVVTGVDASEEMLAVARDRATQAGADVRLLTGDAHALAFPDRSFDIAVCLRVLMHTPRWRLCIDELCRVAKDRVLIDYPSAHSTALLQSLWRRPLHAAGRPTQPYRVFFDGQVSAALDRNGFRVRSVHRQFVLPIALHKMIGSRVFTRASEGTLKRLGVLALCGSPVTLIAERCATS